MTQNIYLKQIEMGFGANFVYFIGDNKTKTVALVDLSGSADEILDAAAQEGVHIKAVFLTHGHYDHVVDLDEFLRKCNVPVYISKDEIRMHRPDHRNVVEIQNSQKIPIGTIEIECIATPGHTPGCMCYKCEDILLTGDTLFIDGCGRCDLTGGDAVSQYHSLYDVIGKLPDATLIYPGHNYGPVPFATLKEQKKTNPYLTCHSLEDFLTRRMG